ncbi:AAA family ATPase [Candidatus Parabeggiatoa sp. HSG14]|uniref:AAA family ATPase n=1 Tax=Candidatus Parabeggiatoa sp. HSG14 TaxID=3055593 RepID=UPI0025A74684|nr:AAA family ATPase [Thiotrichales bacterium HSG14]
MISNYKVLEQIYQSANSLVYRAIRHEDNQAVILKILKEDYPIPKELTRYRQEYDITCRLENMEGVVNAYSLDKHQNTLVMCLEDFGGKSLKHWLTERTFTLNELLTFSIQTIDILGQIHKYHIIHKDINPANLVFNPSTGVLKIIDFGIATQLSRENPTLKNPNVLEGTLAYMSPEQTGRMNRVLDYRTDFYSLGVTFYELFTGQLPFESKDAMELVHCHIAKQPESPTQINPNIPPIISDILLKLLEKTAENRYQSIWGIKADLEKCLLNLPGFQNLAGLHFELAQQDISDRFQIPQKLYGRENEIETLLATFEKVATQSKLEMMLVAGYSGIGKSALVKEIYKSLTEKKGYFITGKFDQFQRNIPYSAIVNAFSELVQQLLTESDVQLTQWKDKLLTALGSNGQVIIDVLPEIELIIGKQPPIPQLGATESQNRFNLVFQSFLRVFCQAEHPLVIFLDDLQWADLATFKLLELVMGDKETKHLYLIEAYRDNEITPTHALTMMLEKLSKENVIINQITLKPLAFLQVKQLIADSLHQNQKMVTSLADLVMRKTEGNPFFINQFLHTLYEEELLTFQTSKVSKTSEVLPFSWHWDIAKIEAMNITDNVVDLMINKLKKLPQSAQQVLHLAACIGNRFNLEILSFLYKKSATETFQDFTPILAEEFVLPTSELELTEDDNLNICHFRFLHDRVQQAAYALIDDNQKKAIHLKIGYLLNTEKKALEDKVFDIVEHLNFSLELVKEQSQRNEIAQLNLIAGQKAKSAMAYEAAIKYLIAGLECLVKNSWKTEYELTLNLYIEVVEAEYINGNHEQATLHSNIVLQQASTLLDKIKIYNILIPFYITQNQMQEAIDTGLQVLEMLGISLLDSPPEKLVIEELYNLPEMVESSKLAALQILASFFAPAVITKPSLIPSVVFTMVDLCVKGGNSPQAAFAYVFYGVIQCSMGNIELGYQFGKLALKVLEQFHAQKLKCKVHHLYNALIRHWKEYVGELISGLRDNIQVGLEIGDLQFSGYSILDYCSNIFIKGELLETVCHEHQQYIELLQKNKQEYSLYYAKVWGQFALNISGEAEDKYCLNGKWFNEAQMLPILQEANNFTPLFCVYLAKGMLYYWFKNYADAIANFIQAENYEQSMVTLMPVAQLPFYASLALLAHYSNTTSDKQAEYLEKVAANQQKIKLWASHIPANYQHKYELVEAEKSRVLGQFLDAETFYEKAITGARENEYLHEEALAYELAAEFYLVRGMDKFAQLYIKDAHYHYQQWGALEKVKDLEERYPQFFTQKVSMPIQVDVTLSSVTQLALSTSHKTTSHWLDLDSVMKASQTLSGEIMLSHLLDKMMHIVIENAGASIGFLLLPQKEKWFIEATGHVYSDKIKVLQSLSLENQPIAKTIIYYVARTKENIVLNDATAKSQFTHDVHIISQCPQSILCTPLVNQGKLTGILYLENNLTTEAFTPDRLQVLQVISSQLAVSIENALLYRTLEQKVDERTAQLANANIQLAEANHEITILNDQLKSENIRMSAELEVSRRLQQMLLPPSTELSQIESLDIAGFMEPADEVGGDYYDVQQKGDRVLCGIGDVTGHGLESGVLAIMTQTAVKTLLSINETDSVKFLTALNETIYHNVQRMNSDKNLTFALLNYQNGQICLTGQHEEMIVVRSGEVELIDTVDLGFPIGLEENIAGFIAQTKVSLNQGDVVVLYTDGITEAINSDKVQYGLERLYEAVKQNWQRTALEIREAVVSDVKAYIGTQKVFDDITLLVLKQQ